MPSIKSLVALLAVTIAAVQAQSCASGLTPTTLTVDGVDQTLCCGVVDGTETCQAPLEASGAAARRRAYNLAKRRQDYFDANEECPASQRACPLPSGSFECIDVDELTSCGGCVSEGTGVDCLSLEGYQGVSCIAGKCVATSCASGYSLSHLACEKH
ncbi:hypothetical protein MNV49_000367 [Pseudohyphozyma bogoriensis]|nr:hypothetical protein MNV49_000367 [Pseudohyphozyma bogoriensis]